MTTSRIGRYEIEKELGRGAMAVVYRAVDPLIGRVVAIKTIRIESAVAMEQTELRQRLYREARSAGNLNHPNIVTIYDIGEQDDLSYIAMEFIEGETLESWLAVHPIAPLDQTLSIIEQIASGLDYAAQRAVIHRDIKPGNVLVTADLRAKIADFGIAKIPTSKMTQTGTVMGTPSYMSPEQAIGKELDGRSDIFSLGVIFYQMLTGERPFAGTNPTTIIYKILHEEPVPPRKLNVTLHPGLDCIVQKMLAKDPDQRFQSCGEVVKAVKDYASFATAPETKAGPAQSPQKKKHTGTVVAVLAFLAIAVAGIVLHQRGLIGPRPGPVASVPPPETKPAPVAPIVTKSVEAPSTPPVDEKPTASTQTAVEEKAPAKGEEKLPAKASEDSPKPKQPRVEPPPEKILPARLSLEFAGAEYPFVLYEGRRRLDSYRPGNMEGEVTAGQHRFRIVAAEVFLDQQLDALVLKPEETRVIRLPGLGSAYIEVPNDAYDGCEILLNGKQLPPPYPATVQKLAAGSHPLLFRWLTGKYAGKELPFSLSIGEKHHYLVNGNPQTGQVTVQQAR